MTVHNLKHKIKILWIWIFFFGNVIYYIFKEKKISQLKDAQLRMNSSLVKWSLQKFDDRSDITLTLESGINIFIKLSAGKSCSFPKTHN